VEFQPDKGSPSSARTDSEGRYTLMYTHEKAGAMVGRHTVRIYTGRTIQGPDGEALALPETLPEKYHSQTELFRDVQPGHNVRDFNL
jgi:hypothetical protein